VHAKRSNINGNSLPTRIKKKIIIIIIIIILITRSLDHIHMISKEISSGKFLLA